MKPSNSTVMKIRTWYQIINENYVPLRDHRMTFKCSLRGEENNRQNGGLENVFVVLS